MSDYRRFHLSTLRKRARYCGLLASFEAILHVRYIHFLRDYTEHERVFCFQSSSGWFHFYDLGLQRIVDALDCQACVSFGE